MKYLLDTDTCIAALRQRQSVIQRLSQVSPSDCAVSMITVFELWCGVEQAQQAATERAKVNRFVSAIVELPFDRAAAEEYGRVSAVLERLGRRMQTIDMMIAARTYDVQRGYDVGLAHEIVENGEGDARAIAIAEAAAEHYDVTNFGILTGISRINDMSTTDGLFAESLLAGMVMTNPDLRPSLEAFFAKQAPRLEPKA